MKYTITINQYAIFKAGLIYKTDGVDWIIIDYLKDFALYKKAKKIIYQNEEYIWLNYNHLIVSLPLLHIKTKSSISARINKLVKLELLNTYRDNDNTLYYTFTDKLIDIIFARNCDINRIQAQKLMSAASKRTDPVRGTITAPVRAGITAQYKTKISIINKDKNNNKDISFSSSFSKNQELNPKTTYTNYKPYKPIRKGRNGFKSMAGGIWNVLDNIRQRGKLTAMRDQTPAQSNLAVLTPGGHNDKAV
jgi:DNA-binding MarR family transcriptional regulator